MGGYYTVNIEVEIYAANLEDAKSSAVEYLNNMTSVRDDEIKESE